MPIRVMMLQFKQSPKAQMFAFIIHCSKGEQIKAALAWGRLSDSNQRILRVMGNQRVTRLCLGASRVSRVATFEPDLASARPETDPVARV